MNMKLDDVVGISCKIAERVHPRLGNNPQGWRQKHAGLHSIQVEVTRVEAHLQVKGIQRSSGRSFRNSHAYLETIEVPETHDKVRQYQLVKEPDLGSHDEFAELTCDVGYISSPTFCDMRNPDIANWCEHTDVDELTVTAWSERIHCHQGTHVKNRRGKQKALPKIH